MVQTAYLFEAKGIQRYILAGGRLLDIAGASDVLSSSVRRERDLLSAALEAAQVPAQGRRFSRRAGGAFVLQVGHSGAAALNRFQALWRLAFGLHAPGLEFSDARGCGEGAVEAKDQAYAAASAVRDNGLGSMLPLAGPLSHRTERTSLPAVQNRDGERLDAAMERKRAFGRANEFANRFLSPDRRAHFQWPVAIDPETEFHAGPFFPFPADTPRRIAIIHADISGLGELYTGFGKTLNRQAAGLGALGLSPIELSLELSQTIEGAVEAAAQAASDVLAEAAADSSDTRTLAARPIVLGGDDLTIIVRGDLALRYACRLLEAIERESAVRLRSFADRTGLSVDLFDRPLTACAGIAIIKSKQPFNQALTLAEALCSYAKKRVKAGPPPFPSAVAFHRVTTSAIAEDFEVVLEREETTALGEKLSGQPYQLGGFARPGAWTLEQLERLKQAMGADGMGASALRDLRTLLLSNRSLFSAAYSNWQAVVGRRSPGALTRFNSDLASFGVDGNKTIFSEAPPATPVFDAYEWRACE